MATGNTRPVWLLGLANYLGLLGIAVGFVPWAALASPWPAAWVGAVWLTYPLLFLAPAFALAWLGSGAAAVACAGRPRLAVAGMAAFSALPFAAVLLLLLTDERIHELYGFHVNGFVWNLVTTRGGISALGAGPETFLAAGGLCATVLAVEGFVAHRLFERRKRTAFGNRLSRRRFVVTFLAAAVAFSGFERVSFAASRVTGYVPILELEEAFPLYQPTSFNSWAEQLGFRVSRTKSLHASTGGGALAYPLSPLAFRADAPRYNVLVLCAESLRADALDPERMPATWAFSQRALRFTQHVSSGNGTRMGVFGLFYGLPGPYWFRFINGRRGPVLLSELQGRGYDVRAFTADDFSYPEFDQTVFADLDRSRLREEGPQGHRPSWQRDRSMTGAMLDYLGQRDPAQPFFMYAFFESPHARYDFPPETAVHKPYLEHFDYLTMNLERDIGQIQNRYWNSVRHLDTQIERVLAGLEERHLLENTIVVITGDHGEEFMETGRWGHNSAFSEPQIRVPLVLSVPGHGAGTVNALTSHLDVPATLLGALGVSNPPDDYSMGHSLLDGPPRRWTLVSDWTRVAYLDADGKVALPMKASSFLRFDVSDRSDRPLADTQAYMASRAEVFPTVMAQLGHLTVARAK